MFNFLQLFDSGQTPKTILGNDRSFVRVYITATRTSTVPMITKVLLKFLQQVINIGEKSEVVFDARHINSNTHQGYESRLIEPLAPQLARANKKIRSAIDFAYGCAHAPLGEETIRFTSFSSRNKYAFINFLWFKKTIRFFFRETGALVHPKNHRPRLCPRLF